MNVNLPGLKLKSDDRSFYFYVTWPWLVAPVALIIALVVYL